MANADLLITIHAAMLEREFEIEGVVHQLFRDRSGELGDGTTLSLPMDSLTHSDSGQNEGNLRGTTASDLAWGAPTIMTSERDNLVANTGYDFYEVVGDLVRQTIRPDLLSESARQHGRLYANNLSKLCYGGLTGMTRVAAQFESYSVATGDWGNAAHQENILKDLEVVQMKMNHAGAPRQSRFALMNFEDLLVIRQGLRADNIHFSGPINDQLIQWASLASSQGSPWWATRSWPWRMGKATTLSTTSTVASWAKVCPWPGGSGWLLRYSETGFTRAWRFRGATFSVPPCISPANSTASTASSPRWQPRNK